MILVSVRLKSLLAVMTCFGLAGVWVRAEETSADSNETSPPRATAAPVTKPKAAKAAAKSAKVKPVSAEREAELLKFVETHHAELATLLKTLKTAQTRDYAAAISDLDREIRRLDQVEKRSPPQYDAELKVWVARSRVRLLSARLSMEDDEELKAELKAQLRELRQLETAALQLEISSVEQAIGKQQQKLDKLKKNLADLQANDEDWLAKQIASLEEKQDKTAKPKNKKKAAAKAKNKSSTSAP